MAVNLVPIRERGFLFEGKARGAPKKRRILGQVGIFRRLNNARHGPRVLCFASGIFAILIANIAEASFYLSAPDQSFTTGRCSHGWGGLRRRA